MQWGFPCCVHFPCVHAAATTPVQQMGILVAQTHPSVSAFSDSTVGSACTSSFSRIARRSLTLRPAHSRGHQIVTVIRRLQTFRHLHACSGRFRLERSPGGACTRWKSAALSRRTRDTALDRDRRNRLGALHFYNELEIHSQVVADRLRGGRAVLHDFPAEARSRRRGRTGV